MRERVRMYLRTAAGIIKRRRAPTSLALISAAASSALLGSILVRTGICNVGASTCAHCSLSLKA